jgi:hypothetical protein
VKTVQPGAFARVAPNHGESARSSSVHTLTFFSEGWLREHGLDVRSHIRVAGCQHGVAVGISVGYRSLPRMVTAVCEPCCKDWAIRNALCCIGQGSIPERGQQRTRWRSDLTLLWLLDSLGQGKGNRGAPDWMLLEWNRATTTTGGGGRSSWLSRAPLRGQCTPYLWLLGLPERTDHPARRLAQAGRLSHRSSSQSARRPTPAAW